MVLFTVSFTALFTGGYLSAADFFTIIEAYYGVSSLLCPVKIMKNIFLCLMAALLILPGLVPAFGGVAFAQAETQAVPSFRDTNLRLPRWASLQGEKTYVRAGPGLKYPIKWIFKKQALPVEIVQEFDSWRKIRDYEGDEGWVHQTLLTGARSVMVRADGLVSMREAERADARLVARVEPAVVARVERCTPAWCKVSVDGFRGWIERNSLWGIYEEEILN